MTYLGACQTPVMELSFESQPSWSVHSNPIRHGGFIRIPAGIHLLKVNNKNTRTRCGVRPVFASELLSSQIKIKYVKKKKKKKIKVSDKTPERRHQACNLIKKRLQHKCVPVNIAKFIRTPIVKNICKRLLVCV